MTRPERDDLEEVYSIYSRDSTTQLSPESSTSSHSTMDLSEPSLIPFTRNQSERHRNHGSPLLTYSPTSPSSPFGDSRATSTTSSPSPSLYRASPPNSLMVSGTGSTAFASRPPHLRQRSQPSGQMRFGSDSGMSDYMKADNPFENTAYRVAMSREGSVSSHDLQAGTAMNMRGDRAEWVGS